MKAIEYIIEVLICSGLFLVLYRWLLGQEKSATGSAGHI